IISREGGCFASNALPLDGCFLSSIATRFLVIVRLPALCPPCAFLCELCEKPLPLSWLRSHPQDVPGSTCQSDQIASSRLASAQAHRPVFPTHQSPPSLQAASQ